MFTIKSIEQFQDLADKSEFDNVVSGLDNEESLLNISLWLKKRSVLEPSCVVVCLPSQKKMKALHSEFQNLISQPNFNPELQTAMWPFVDYWSSFRFQNPAEEMEAKLECLNKVCSGKPLIIFTTHIALFQLTLTCDDFEKSSIKISLGDELDTHEISEKFKSLGYQRTGKVEEKGYFSIRGGLVDIFTPGSKYPVRIELLGDEVTSIRYFSEETQRSIKALDSYTVMASIECILHQDQKSSHAQKLHDYLLSSEINKFERQGILEAFHENAHFSGFYKVAPILRDSSDTIAAHIRKSYRSRLFIDFSSEEERQNLISESIDEANQSYEEDLNEKRLTVDPKLHGISIDNQPVIKDIFSSGLKMGIEKVSPGGDSFEDNLNNFYSYKFSQQKINRHVLASGADKQALFDSILNDHEKESLVFVCENESRVQRLETLLLQRGNKPKIYDSLLDLRRLVPGSGEVILLKGSLERDYFSEDNFHLIPSSIFWGKIEEKGSKEKRLKNYLKSFKDLKENDLVVHVMHGIGKFLSMQTMTIGQQMSEFLVLEYAGGDKVYVPIDKVNLLQRYTPGGTGKSVVPLDRLTGSSWEKRKSKVRAAVEIMAEELLSIHAKRAIAKGTRYGIAAQEFQRFVEDFPYQETRDQLKVVEEIEEDLTSGKIMDRLLIGDVGFGKTEVAMRAAFRAVMEGRQVMVLAPTTVLCYQHFDTFHSRMSKYGVTVRPVNRFVNARSVKETKEGWANGSVDILVGTHKILNKMFVPKRLGLLVVDEEQRFGVGHKERIKELKNNASILTMSATPIPRTLHMSMLGLRDISILAEAPHNRMSVKNFLISFDEQLIRNAVNHELKRGGQVFVVHNRVEDIADIANFISKACGNVEVRVGHGQQSEKELESVIKDFIDGKFKVLVCTTIIESGIDMPNVNTIIVNNAHHFGLSQLYQLRGRVGRSGSQAYAYFITPPLERLTEESRKRLQVLMAHQELGSGFHIASHDMEIRGTGNILGEKQSGHVATVGIELYTKMLEEAIHKVRGETFTEEIEPEIKLHKTAVIPSNYIEDQTGRLAIYKKVFSIETEDGIEQFKHDMIDQYGELPDEFATLLEVAIIKILLKKLKVNALVQRNSVEFELKFFALSEKQIGKMLKIAGNDPASFRLMPDYKLRINIDDAPTGTGYSQLISKLELLFH